MPRRSKPWRIGASSVLVIVAAGAPALAGREVVHEYFEPDAQEDMLFRATTLEGSMPAALETPSGVVRAPDPSRSPYTAEKAYGGASTPDSRDASYGIDRDTTRPDTVGYDEPFNPAITPFKRLYAYDAVDEEFELVVKEKALRPIPIGGAAAAGDDQFYGDMVVDLVKDEPVRVPSVGPGTRVLAAELHPATEFELLADGAENWFLRARDRRRARLTLVLAVPRASFGSVYPEVRHEDLPQLGRLPPAVERSARRVASRLGIHPDLGPKVMLEMLVAHFRGFAPSTALPEAREPAALYEDLALSQKGVCRHRAYAFVITAHALGIPARLVRNEAHAWVEVHDGKLWHRIDLGGAANNLDLTTRDSIFQHVPPPDPYHWPKDAESAAQMTERALAAMTSRGAPPNEGSSSAAQAPLAASELALTTGRAAGHFELVRAAGDVRRGGVLAVSGRFLDPDGAPCAGARVDVGLRAPGGAPIPLGSLASGPNGEFAGSVSVRLDIDVGEYHVLLSSPGGAGCGASAMNE